MPIAKVFCFFFSKKKTFFLLTGAAVAPEAGRVNKSS
jgi:hypothetical protein